jgi:hypothetical protein
VRARATLTPSPDSDTVHAMPRSEPSRAFAAGPLAPSTPKLSRLLIHATEGAGEDSGGMLSVLLHRLRTCAAAATRRRPPAPMGVCVEDLQGRRFFTSAEAGAVIDVPLPAGTYHVDVRHGSQQRRYTVTLAHEATVNLHLCGKADPR